MAKRRVLSLRWRWFHWELRSSDGSIYPGFGEKNKKGAITEARSICRMLFVEGQLGQLRVFNKNGRIAFEATYARDPRRTAG